MSAKTNIPQMEGLKKEILKTLTYFNLFNYPLQKREIFIFLGKACAYTEFELALEDLVRRGNIHPVGDYYSLFNNYALAERRRDGNERAARLMKKAQAAASNIGRFPFVRGVAVSGSLSKRVADKNADIDFFIITAPNRLWIARSILHIFKKFTFLVNLQDHYCMNYFIDEAEPVIIEKNIYTATEVVTLIPMMGCRSFTAFFRNNRWTRSFFPNNNLHVPAADEIKTGWMAKCLEKALNNRLGNRLDAWLMSITDSSWRAKTRRNKKNSKGLPMGMHSGPHFSKPDPIHFQRRLLQRFNRSVREVIDQYEALAGIKNKTV